jgi:hypothetical protein
MEPNLTPEQQQQDAYIERAASQLFQGGGLEFSHLARPEEAVTPEDNSTLTNDDIYDFMQENRDRTFDHTTREGVELFRRFEEANARRNKFTLGHFKQMVGTIAKVPVDLAVGVFGNNPLVTAGSVADGVARDARDMYAIMLQSEDPSSPLFRFKNFIFGDGTVEDRIKQFNEARWWGNQSNALEEGKDTILEHVVPDNYREFARSLIDPKFANAVSYIGLDTPQFIKSAFKKSGIKASLAAFKDGDIASFHKNVALEAAQSDDWFKTTAKKFRELSQKITGETLVGGAEVASKPFEFVREKIARGSAEIEAKIGYVPPEISNGASTLLADVGSTVTREGLELSPIKSVLFSMGIKPIAEYASVLGNELIDASQGVVRVKGQHSATGLMQRLALNGGRIPLSVEGQAVAKFANVVVGWPASMSFPALKRAVGDAAYMGALGYLNARGEGASSGMGVGFAWGGLSGGIRHLHNVYNQSVAHSYIIENFDKAQIHEIAKSDPEKAENMREYLAFVDSHGDVRTSAVLRAEMMLGHSSIPETGMLFQDYDGLVKKFGLQEVSGQFTSEATAREGNGALLTLGGRDYIWVNKSVLGSREVVGHEFSHGFLDALLSRTDGNAYETLVSFLGDAENKGILPDEQIALLFGSYSQRIHAGKDPSDPSKDKWLNSSTPSPAVGADDKIISDYGNVAYMREKLKAMRNEMASDPSGMRKWNYDSGKPRLQALVNYPMVERAMHEIFAYSRSNRALIQSPDYYLRDPRLKSFRHVLENWNMLMNQRVVSNIEQAGGIIRQATKGDKTALELAFWHEGKYISFPTLDKWTEETMRRVLKHNDVSVTTMSPERAEMYMKQTRKERFLNGRKMKTKKEVEEQITSTTDAVAAVLDKLPDAVKPTWEVTRGGNRKIKLTELSAEAWTALADSGVYHPDELSTLHGMVDVLKQIEAGKPVFNTYNGQYIGWSQQVVEAALGERLKGRQVPITFRNFAPFDIELIQSKFDESGAPLKTPRSHITIHAHDITVLNKRKMNVYSRDDAKVLFKDFGHFSETFVNWFSQLSQDPSIRVPSADFLRPEFGKNAEKVRDLMYETWGGRKRNDETYINVPEGYSGGKDGPLYPIHSLRFDLLANVQKQSQVFPEAFRGNLMGLFHRHGIAYEPMRRNMMVGGFVQRELGNGRRFYTDGNGFEIRGEEPKLKLFNMYGNLVGVFKTMDKAQRAAERHLKTIPIEEVGISKDDLGDAQISEPVLDVIGSPAKALSGGAFMMTGEKGSADYNIDGSLPKVKGFIEKALTYQQEYKFGFKTKDWNQAPQIKVLDLISDSDRKRVLEVYPEADRWVIEANMTTEEHGGYVGGYMAGPQANVLAFVHPDRFSNKGDMVTLSTEINLDLQMMLMLKEGVTKGRVLPFMMNDVRGIASHASFRMLSRIRFITANELGKPFSSVTHEEILDQIRASARETVLEVREDWQNGGGPAQPKGRSINSQNKLQSFINRVYPSGVRTFPDGSPRINYGVRAYFGGVGTVPDNILADLNNWACNITEALDAGKMLVVSAAGATQVFMDSPYLSLPISVENYFNANRQLWEPLSTMLQKAKLTHGVSKYGNREVSTKFDRSNNEAFIKENIALGDPSFAEGSVWKSVDGRNVQVSSAVRPYPAVQTKTALGSLFKGSEAIVVTFSNGDLRSDFDGQMQPRAYVSAEGAVFMTGIGESDKALSTTSSPSNSRSGPLVGGIHETHGVIMGTTQEMIASGSAPFSGGVNGTLHGLYAKRAHLAMLHPLLVKIGVDFDPAKDMTPAGLSRVVKEISSQGVDSPDKAYVHRVAKGCLLTEIGREILDGDPNNRYGQWVNEDANARVPEFLTKTEYGQNLVNGGFGQIAFAVAMSSSGMESLKVGKQQKLAQKGNLSLVEESFADKNANLLSKRIRTEVNSFLELLKKNGYNPHRMSKRTGVTAHLMLGGMRARELDMIASGAMRFVKTDSGKMYKAFEFSDKDASLLTEKVGGKLHLLPFSKGGEADFEAYYKDYVRGQAPLMSTDSLKLGELIDHKILFAHYPSLKDVRVEWDYGYGASYNPDADVITLGVDRYIGKEMHERGSSDHVDYASFGIDFERKAMDTILHEIQHAIQRREQWTDSVSTRESTLFQRAGQILTNNITGVAGRTLSTERVQNEGGRVFFTDDPSSAPTQFANAQVIRSIVQMAGSPMHMHLRQYAYPNLLRVSEEVMLGLADGHMHHPAGHMSRVNAENLSKKIGAVRSKAMEAMEAFKRGDLRETEAKDLVCEQVMQLESLIESGVGMLSIENSPLAFRLYNGMNNSLKYMRRSMQALNAFQIISKMADTSVNALDVGAFSAKAKEIFETVSTMQYLSQKHEIEADLTERRSQMTQEELNATGINPDMTRVNGLDAISGAMDIGYAGNSIRAIGLALKNKTPIRVANLMIGGTGDAKLKPEERSSDAVKLMGKGALISWTVRVLQNELDMLNAVAVYGRGWEIGKDGVPRLSFRDAIIRVKGSTSIALNRERVTNLPDLSNSSVQQQGDKALGIFAAIAADGETTVTLQDIARIIDGVVVSESEIRTPTEAMDIITRDDFPSVIKPSELPELLKKKGISDDGLLLSNSTLFSQIDASDMPETLTKGELIDIMSIVHRQIVHERTATRSMGSGIIARSKTNVGAATPSKLTQAIESSFDDETRYGGDDQFQSFIKSVFGDRGMPKQFNAEFKGMYAEGGRPNRFTLVNIDYNTGTARFRPEKPEWVEADVWNALIERWTKKGYMEVGYFGSRQAMKDTDADSRMKGELISRARDLNKRLFRKLFLLKPFYEMALSKLQENLSEKSNPEQLMAIKLALMDEASLAMIEPDLAGFRVTSNVSRGQNTNRGFGASMSFMDSETLDTQETTRTSNQLGIAPQIYASGFSPEVRDAFVELHTMMPVVGFTSESSTRSGGLTNSEAMVGRFGVQFYSLLDDLGDRYFAADNVNVQANLMSVTTSALATQRLTEKVIQDLTDREEGMHTSELLGIRLIGKIAAQAAELGRVATLLVGDPQGSTRDSVHRNVQRNAPNSYIGNEFIQELSLLRGYRGADGGLVLQENLMADTSASLAHKRNIELPIWNHTLSPAGVGSKDFNAPAVRASVMKDLAVRSLVFGAMNDGAGNVTRPMSYIAPLADLAANIISAQGSRSELGVRIDFALPYTTGLHALHSATYLMSWEKGVEISSPLTQDADFYRAWAQPNPSNLIDNAFQSGHNPESVAIAAAPFVAAAMSEKAPLVKGGNLTTGDILSVEQRELLKKAREAYRNHDPRAAQTVEMRTASREFFETLNSKQITAILSHLGSSNSAYGIITMLGVFNAIRHIKKLPEAPALSQKIGGDARAELLRQMDFYLTEGRYLTEMGVNKMDTLTDMYQKGHVPQTLLNSLAALFTDKHTWHALLSAWSVMDSNAVGYVPRMSEGEVQVDRPHSSIMTHVSPMAYRNQNATFRAFDTAVGGRFSSSPSHPNRIHSIVPADTLRVQERELQAPKIGMDGEPIGLAEALFKVYDPAANDPEPFSVVESQQNTNVLPDLLIGVHKTQVANRGNEVSQPLIRKYVVDSIIAQARRMKTDKVSIEPARFRNSGRAISRRGLKSEENESGLSSPKFRAHADGIGALFGTHAIVPDRDNGMSTIDSNTESRPFMTSPMMGFAWKRLEDGRLVINVTGDHTGYKSGYLGTQYFPYPNARSKIPVGFSISESLGYDPYTGEINPANIHMALFGDMSVANYLSAPAGMNKAMSISGEAWRKQLIKSARAKVLRGDSIRARYEGVEGNKAGIPWKHSRAQSGFETLMSSDSAHTNADALAMAYSILGHRTGHQYVSMTLPANSTPEVVRAFLHNLLIGGSMMELGQVLARRTFGDYSANQVPFLGDGAAIHGVLHSTVSNFSPANQRLSRMGALMADTIVPSMTEAMSMDEILLNNGQQLAEVGTPMDLDRHTQVMSIRSQAILGRNPRLIQDIESVAGMALRSDHGYSIPDAERHVTKNGDTALAIELMFPNRPELQKFAWDGKEENGVSIVHRGPKAKPTGYFVTYDYQTGIDEYGNPITTKKVVPVKTLAEAENIRSQFGVKASKAIMAQALVAAGMEAPQIKQGVTNKDGNVDFGVHSGKQLKANEQGLSMVLSKTFTVGDFDKQMTNQEAVAVSEALQSGTVLQTSVPQVQVKPANLMIGSRDARELEGLLRRKLTFGNGSGPVEFSSKLMRVVAYGKRKMGRDLYPDSMTGVDWYKFFKENQVSKDEMRMTGIVYLLHDNMNTMLSRQDLAEFIYTVYPRTSRQVRRENRSTMLSQNHNIRAGSLSGLYNLPYIDNVQSKENFVVTTHLDNLKKVSDFIDQKLLSEDTKTDAEALGSAIQKSLEFTIAEMGLPAEVVGQTLADTIQNMRDLYRNTAETAATPQGFYGDSRGVRPAQLDYIMRDVIWERLGDQYKTIEASIGELGFINPYEIAYADQSVPKFNPFNPTSSDTADAAVSLHSGTGLFAKAPATEPYPSMSQQGVYFHGGNYHASYATFVGNYQSSPMFVDVTNKRIIEESKRAKETLKDRMAHANSPEQKKKIQSIIDAIERVEAVRKMVGGNVADFSHYDQNDQGTFQLGHVRSTMAVLNGEYGIASPNDPAFHGEDPVSGFKFDPETVIGIEEIQSDPFQYNTFGAPTKAEASLPDTFEQIEGLKKASDLGKLIEAKRNLEASIKEAQGKINENLHYQMMSNRGDVRMNTMFLMKNLGLLSPIELYMLRDTLKLKETGRTMVVPEHYREYVGKDTIPVYSQPDFSVYRKPPSGRDDVSVFTDMDDRRETVQTGRRISIQIQNLASGDVLAYLLPEKFMGSDLFERFSYRDDASGRPQPTASFVFMVHAAQDPEVVAKSVGIADSRKNSVAHADIDWDAVAARTIDRIEAMRDKVLSGDNHRHQEYLRDYSGPKASRLAKAKFFDNLIATYRERLQSPRNQMAMPEVNTEGDPNLIYMGKDYDVGPLAQQIRNNPNRYVLIKSSVDVDRTNPAQLLFPLGESMLSDVPYRNLDYTELKMAPDVSVDEGGEYGVQFVAANTALGQFASSSVSGLVAYVSSLGTVPVEIKKLQEKIDALAKEVPISTSGNMPRLANTLPFGVEDIYKPVALTGTILRAANAGFGAITYADARMQVLRGHSMDLVATMLIGRQANMLPMSSDSVFAHVMTQIHLLPEAVRVQLHGNFFKRLAEEDNAFFERVFRRGAEFEHNGAKGDIRIHMALAAKEAAPLLMGSGIFAGDFSDAKDFWRAVTSSGDMTASAADYIGSPSDMMGASSESNLLDENLKPIKPKDNSTEFMKKWYGNVVSGEKNDRQRVIDSAAANAGSSTFYWSEQGRAMGYVSQYGAPSWFIQSIMFGQKQSSIDKFSTDAFQRPMVTVANDGTYTLVDPKSGRAIMEKISNPTILREAFFQNSKYLGQLPYISKFMAEWGSVGGYVTQGHIQGNTTGESMRNQLISGFELSEHPKKYSRPQQFAGVVKSARENSEGVYTSGDSFRNSANKAMAPFGHVFNVVGAKLWMRHMNKVDVNDAEALGKAMATYFSVGGPVLRFKPRMPSEAHKKAFRKKIVEGIALLMPSNGGKGRPEANTSTLEMMDRMYKNFSRVTMGRKIPTQGDALEDEDESAR